MTAPERLRVLVVDDEPPARRVLMSLLEAEPGVEVVGSCGNGEDAIRALREEEVDVLFLDIQMPEVGGFEVLEALEDDELPLVIFVTAHDAHAIRAFEVGAVDYLLKPFDDERFRAALGRVRERALTEDRGRVTTELRALLRRMAGWEEATPVETQSPEPNAALSREKAGRVAVRIGNRIALVDLDDVSWIEAQNYYVRLHVGARSYLLRDTLSRLEARLDPEDFVRVHRSAIVRIASVIELQLGETGGYMAVLEDGTKVKVSRTRQRQVMNALGLSTDPGT